MKFSQSRQPPDFVVPGLLFARPYVRSGPMFQKYAFHHLLLALAFVFSLCQCDKKESGPAPSKSAGSATSTASPAATAPTATAVSDTTAPTSAKPKGLTAHAAKLGFAAMLPEDTELYLGTVSMKQHMTALKQTAFYKEVSGMMSDKLPAPAAEDRAMKALQDLWGDEMFMAGSKGFGQFMTWLGEFNKFYNEMNFRMLMTGGMAGASQTNRDTPMRSTAIFSSLFSDPAQIEHAAGIIARFELPPVIIGIKNDKAAEIARNLIPEESLKRIPADKITVGTIKTADGSEFRTLTTEGARLIADAEKKNMMENIPPSFDAKTRGAIEKALADFQAKKFAFAWGAVGGHVIFAVGSNLDHLKFVSDPASSLLAKPELAKLEPMMSKNLFMLSYANGETMKGAVDDEPFTPMLRGITGAMKGSPVFSNMAALLESQLQSYTPAEKAVFKRQVSTQVVAAWWDKGIHLESFGGMSTDAMDYSKGLSYASLIDKPGVIAGFAYQRSLPFEKLTREWMEKLFGLGYTAVQEMMKAGIGGEQGAQGFAMFEAMAMPALKKLYEADRELVEKGLGSQAAFILDINGKMPPLPNIPNEAKDLKFPRITTVSEVTDRAVVAESWKKMSSTINETITAFSGAGGSPGAGSGAPGSAGAGFVMPEPISSEKNGMTTWFFAMPYLVGDMLPCASINDKVLLLSTSKDAAESFAGELAKSAPSTMNGMVWRIDLGALVEWGASAAQMAPKQSSKDEAEMKQVLKWVKPFHAMQGRVFREDGIPRQSFSWEITDLVSFD